MWSDRPEPRRSIKDLADGNVQHSPDTSLLCEWKVAESLIDTRITVDSLSRDMSWTREISGKSRSWSTLKQRMLKRSVDHSLLQLDRIERARGFRNQLIGVPPGQPQALSSKRLRDCIVHRDPFQPHILHAVDFPHCSTHVCDHLTNSHYH